MSRNPRAGPSTGLTKTQQLRQARSAALVKDLEKKREDTLRRQADPFSRRSRVVRPEPKKVDFSKPGMTKAMIARVKQAEKFKQEYERKQEMLTGNRQPKRTPAPIGGDARAGRERIPGREPRRSSIGVSRPASRPTSPLPASPPRRELETRRTPIPSPKRNVVARRLKSPEPTVSRKTNELARMMNADIIQADPIGEGPISNIVLPPGIVSDNRTTIVSIQQPGADIEAQATSQLANRSIQVISDTLNEQDALETSAVQSRLAELQQARRDFVIAVANVGANAVNIEEETPPASLMSSIPETPPRHLIRVPDLEDEYLQPQFGIDHPDVVAARKFLKEKEAAKRIQEEFERIAATEHVPDELLLDVPFEEQLFGEKDIPWEEEEAGIPIPPPSRVKAQLSPVPKQQTHNEYDPFDTEHLEKFFDVQYNPPCPVCGPPPGRENIHPDLWELDDPWFAPPPAPEVPDLIEFDLIDF